MVAPGDVHVHVYMGGLQYWVCGKDMLWQDASLGCKHPQYGRRRVLSHRPPHSDKLPSWVANSTLVTYKSKARQEAKMI